MKQQGRGEGEGVVNASQGEGGGGVSKATIPCPFASLTFFLIRFICCVEY